jgi:hypothetical protein
MMICRALLIMGIVGLSLQQAGAQFGGMPGMPGGPGFTARPAAPPPQCVQLLKIRDEVEKHGKAIQTANERKATVQVACKLFKTYLAAEARMIKGLEQHGTTCGAPPDVLTQMRASHAKASQVGKQVCEAAAQGARPAGPSLSDALGASPPLPSNTQKGAGVFDTLTGNPFAR